MSAVWRHVYRRAEDVALPAYVLSSLSAATLRRRRCRHPTDDLADRVASQRADARGHVSLLSPTVSASGRRSRPASGELVLRSAGRTTAHSVQCRRSRSRRQRLYRGVTFTLFIYYLHAEMEDTKRDTKQLK